MAKLPSGYELQMGGAPQVSPQQSFGAGAALSRAQLGAAKGAMGLTDTIAGLIDRENKREKMDFLNDYIQAMGIKLETMTESPAAKKVEY